MDWSTICDKVIDMMTTEFSDYIDIVEEVRKNKENPQEGIDKLVDAFLIGRRYFHEFLGDVRDALDILIVRGAVFPTEKLFLFNDWSIEDQVQNFNVRAFLLQMMGGTSEHENFTNVEEIWWEELQDTKPTKENLMRCLKYFMTHIKLSDYID